MTQHNGDEHQSEEESKKILEQLRAANGLAKPDKVGEGVISEVQRLRAHNKVVPGLGDVMKRTRKYTNNEHGR